MILIVAVVLALLTVPLLGGRLARLTEVRLRWPWLPVGALAAQVVILTLVDLADGVTAVLHMATYVPVGVFLFRNRAHAGLWVVGAGFAMNSMAIAANGGVMPADGDALRRAGLDHKGDFANSGVVEEPRLAWLGDVFAWPEPMPFANVFSAGDVAVVLGVGAHAHLVGGSRLVRRWVASTQADAAARR